MNASAAGEKAREAQWLERCALLVAQVRAVSTHPSSELHGEAHARGVARIGAHLLAQTRRADPALVFAFAALHDALRLHDGADPQHGERAAGLASQLGAAALGLDPTRLELLESALWVHDQGEISFDPSVGVCWDADRLSLWRLGMVPDPRLLSTTAARAPETVAWAREAVDRHLIWDELAALYARLQEGRVHAG